MKRIIVVILISFLFILPVKADLTKEQEEAVAGFAENFIIEGNKRLDKNGYPLLAYMQGQARIDGFQSKLYKINYDYNHHYSVNAKKWTFDCASYAAYVYHHTLNLTLTFSVTSKVDPYSGLKIRSATANPYYVKEYVADADRGEHFYYIKKGVTGANLNTNDLKKGDLIIYVGHHIMIYVGDGKVAEATTSCINKNNLGMQVIPLIDKYYAIPLSVIRVKNKIVSPSIVANTKVTWLDNNETVELVEKVDPIEEYPKINYTNPSTDWAKSVKITFKLSAVNGLKSYSFSDDQDNWMDISGNSYDLNQDITKNGTYYLKVKDSKNNETKETIEINTIDDTKPVITSLSFVEKDKYSVIEVKALDEESGLADKPYSFDNGLTWTDKNTYEVTVEKTYDVLVKDNVGNIISMSINAKLKEVSTPVIGNIIFGEENNGTKKVSFIVLNCNDCEILIKETGIIPSNNDIWAKLSGVNFITYLKAGNYTVYLRDSNGKTSEKMFRVELTKTDGFNARILIFIIPLILIVVGFILIKKRKINNI